MIHQGRSISHTFTDRSNLSHVFATPIPVIVNNHYIVFSIKPDCSYIAIFTQLNRTVFVSDTEGQNYTLTNFTEMFNVLPRGLKYNMKTDKFYSDFVTGMIRT
jgi:hypothetical protein